ncbi:hypothetical protein Ahy_A09g043128 [Arachis hypogaea]|uniref:Retrotransposon gag domain-containing protein n=1 Tax=Arachis hypogaea TaxID=3818 RepID=A0A445BHK9_ARAHY|nr:hypothetical protein Ahy_A09g043128 [Arachis hypogaea]
MIDNQTKKQALIIEMMARDQTRNHQELKIREFSKSLIGRVFTWYAKLKTNSINTWEQLLTEFRNKFLEEEPSMHIMDRERVKQIQGERLVAFIKRYRDQALLCMDTLLEPQLRASDIIETMKHNGRRFKEASPLEVSAVDGKGGRHPYSRSSNKNTTPLPLPSPDLSKGLRKHLVFRDPDSFNGEFYHNKSLYVEAVVEGMNVRRALVDVGSGLNIIPSYIFLEMRGSTDQIRPTQVRFNAFNGMGIRSRGCINVVLEIGTIKTNNKFHVVDGNPSYHILLGRLWIHLHWCVPSSWHQCIKSN